MKEEKKKGGKRNGGGQRGEKKVWGENVFFFAVCTGKGKVKGGRFIPEL